MPTLNDARGRGIEALLLPGGFDCDCGKRHMAPLATVRIGRGVINELPDTVRALGMRAPAVVADESTWAAAGERAFALLQKAGLAPARCVLPSPRPEDNETWLGRLTTQFPPACDGIVSVGSGTIGDLCKMLAGVAKVPLVNLGTAPSMDGFSSSSAAMLVGGLKVSLPAPCPNAVLADTEVMAAAPPRMLLAGLGDMLAKHVSIGEWRISHIVNGEYYCPHVAALVRDALARCKAAADGLLRREPDAVAATVEGLVLCGVAMSFAGVTRPASGVEHYFSHVWEMMAVREGRLPDLHGIQVGVGVALTLPLYERLRREAPSAARAEASWRGFDEGAWRTRTESHLALRGEAAEKQLAWVRNGAERRRAAALAHWQQILAVIDEELPAPGELAPLYGRIGLPASPAAIGLSTQQARDAFIDSRDIRDKYVLSTLLSDLGLLEAYAETIA